MKNIRHLGYACINTTLSDVKKKSERIFTNRTLRMASFNLEKVSDLILQNVTDLKSIMLWNAAHNIHLFRISSDIFPFIDHPELKYSINDLKDYQKIVDVMYDVGKIAKENDIRITSHPGPYNCLASPTKFTVHKTILSLNAHALLGELLDAQDFIINIHVGGSYGGDFDNTAQRFCDNFLKLNPNTQKWLTIENDDKSSMWSVSRLHKLIHSKINIPIILDTHHWQFCNEETLNEAAEIALSTWGSRFPKIHYSESNLDKRPQAHSDFIQGPLPIFNGEYDIMVEAKKKELAILPFLLTNDS